MRKADFFLILVIALMGIALLLLFSSKDNAQSVEISLKGNLIGTYSIHEDRDININATLGQMTIHIMDKSVWVSKSLCPDLLEVKQGKISRSGQSLICIPNEVVISIVGRKAVKSVSY